MSFLVEPLSSGGLPSRTPPVARSVLIELQNTQPSDVSLPASARSCMYGGSSMANDSSGTMRPLVRSNLWKIIAPRYFSLYSLISAYAPPRGAAYCEVSMTYSVLGVTKVAPCSDSISGEATICTVVKSFRSITAMRGLALSLTKMYWPSYSPLVSERAGWCMSPQVMSLSWRRPPARIFLVASSP